MRLRTVLIGLVVVIVAVPLAIVAYIATLGPEDFKRIIAERGLAETGRTLSIDGPLEVHLSMQPSITAQDIRFQNAPWGSQPDLAAIDYFEAQIDLLPLFRGTIDITRVVSSGVDVLLETSPDGVSNLSFAEPPAPAPGTGKPSLPAVRTAPKIPVVRDVDVTDVSVTLHDQRTDGVRTVHVSDLNIDGTGPHAPLYVEVHGDLDRLAFELLGQLGAPAEMLAPTQPWPVSLVGTAAGVSVDFAGTLEEPTLARGMDLAIQVSGPEIGRLSRLSGQTIPDAGPFRIAATIQGDLDGTLAVREIVAVIGQSDELSIDVRGEIASLMQGRGIDLSMAARGSQLSHVAALTGMPLPALGPYDMTLKVAGDLDGTFRVSELDARIGAAETLFLAVNGSIDSAMRGQGIDLKVQAQGGELAAVPDYLPFALPDNIELPPVGPYDVRGRVSGDLRAVLAVQELDAKIGTAERLYLELTGGVASAMDGQGLDLRGRLQGAELADLNRLIPADMRAGYAFPAIGAFYVAFSAQGDVKGTLSLADLDVSMGTDETVALAAAGSIGSVMTAGGLDLRTRIYGNELAVLNDVVPASLLGELRFPDIGSFDFAGLVKGDADGILTLESIDAKMGERRTAFVTVRGSVTDAITLRELDIRAQAQGWETATLNILLPPVLLGGLEIPQLGPYDVAANVRGDLNEVFGVRNLQAVIGADDNMVLSATGDIANARDFRGLNLSISGRGRDLALLASALDMDAPVQGPFQMSAGVRGGLGDRLEVEGLDLILGESDARGNLTVEFAGERATFDADLESRFLDIDALTGAEPLTADQRAQRPVRIQKSTAPLPLQPAAGPSATAPSDDTYRRVFPHDPLPFDIMDTVQGTLSARVARLVAMGQDLQNVVADAELKDRQLSLMPFQAVSADGAFDVSMTLNASTEPAELALTASVSDFYLGRMLASLGVLRTFQGRMDVDIRDTRTRGQSVRDLMANLDGKVSFTMGSGSLGTAEINALSKGTLPLLRLLVGGQAGRTMTVNCFVGEYTVTAGVAHTDRMLFDTDIVTARGGGDIDLRSEQLKLVVAANPKGRLFVPPAGVEVRGTLAEPVIDVKSNTAVGTTGGLVIGRILGSALDISRAGTVLPGQVLDSDAFPCEGVPGASNVRPSEPKRSDGNGDDQDETPLDVLDEKVDEFFKGILGR